MIQIELIIVILFESTYKLLLTFHTYLYISSSKSKELDKSSSSVKVEKRETLKSESDSQDSTKEDCLQVNKCT